MKPVFTLLASVTLAVSGAVAAVPAAAGAAPTPTCTSQCYVSFDTSASLQTFTVPAGLTSITVYLYGAGGGDYRSGSMQSSGGGAGLTTLDLAVSSGDTLSVGVGGRGGSVVGYDDPTGRDGGAFGGGTGGTGTFDAGAGGGGGSFLFDSSGGLLAAAGGGGGAGRNANGGAGSGGSSSTGATSGGPGRNGATGGQAATPTAHGGAGASVQDSGSLTEATPGTGVAPSLSTVPRGGTGASAASPGGGGGGGYFAGGGGGGFAGITDAFGGGGAGGGGEGYVAPSITSYSSYAGISFGDGRVVMSWSPRPPAAPASAAATAGDGSATVTWSASSSVAGTPTYTVSSGTYSCTTTLLTCTISGLPNGVPRTFSVVATNTEGSSSAVVTNSITPRALPASPGGFSAEPGDEAVSLSWSAPVGGAAVTDYVVLASVDGITWNTVATPTGTAATISGLTNGQRYEFRVAARNSSGTGATATVGSTPFRFVPAFATSSGALAGASVTPGAQLTVSGTAQPAGASVSVRLGSTGQQLGTATVAPDGGFSVGLRLPATLGLGAESLVATISGTGTQPRDARADFTVVAASAPLALATTGNASVLAVAGLGAVLALTGLALLVARRRSSRRSTR